MLMLELDLVGGGAFDVKPDFVVLAESFDEFKNEQQPDATAFVLAYDGPQLRSLFVTNPFETLQEALQVTSPNQFINLTTGAGNRITLRPGVIQTRSSTESGTTRLLIDLGQPTPLDVKESVSEIREIMRNLTAPEGLQEIPVEIVEEKEKCPPKKKSTKRS